MIVIKAVKSILLITTEILITTMLKILTIETKVQMAIGQDDATGRCTGRCHC